MVVASNGYEVGAIKWFGGFNSKTGDENDYGFISSLSGEYFFHRSQTLSSPASLIAGAGVLFQPSTDRRGRATASAVRVFKEMTDAELVGLLKQTNGLSAEAGVTIASLRNGVAPCEDEVLRVVSILSRDMPEARVLADFWNKFPPIGPSDPLFQLAPQLVKSNVCKQYYSPLLKGLRNLFASVSDAASSIPSAEVYAGLTKEDRSLADYWAKGQNEAVLAKMLSARAAENAAKQMYERVGLVVEDVSITQLDEAGGDWVTHDLLLNSSLPIDVKNARRPLNASNFYVEHTVARFKHDRSGLDVRIAGVLSPYLNLKYINDPTSPRFRVEDIVYIGETSRNDIERLKKQFGSENFEVVRSHERTFPHWAFGYPIFWYHELLAEITQTLNDCDWPDDEGWRHVLGAEKGLSNVPALCLLGHPLPEVISSGLLAWQVQFFAVLQSAVGCPPSLPAVFFSVLTDFLAALREDRADFNPQGYLLLLYPPGCSHPLGAIDPLGLVRTLVTTLTTLWDNREESNLHRFSSFRFGALGVLQGREKESREWTTIIAYCGGTVFETDEAGSVILTPEGQPLSPKGKCGRTPLVIGTSRSCPSCRKLVCDKCGFCSAPCQEQYFRAVADEAKRKHSAGRLGAVPSSGGADMPDWELIPIEAYEEDFRRR